jgi:drug/metabolite transporter (DMT)-like permease
VRAWRGALLLAAAIVLWGTAVRAHTVGADHAPALAFAAIRVLPAALVLTAVALAAGWGLSRRNAGWAALTGLLMVAVTLGGISEAIPRAGAAQVAVIFNTYPFFVLVAGVWVLRERLSRMGVAGLFAGFAGLVILVSSQAPSPGGAHDLATGTAIAAAAAVAWGGGTVIVARLLKDGEDGFDLLSFTAVQHIAGGLVLALLALPLAGDVEWGSGELWLAGAWVSIGSSAVATVAFFAAMQLMTAARASSWQFLVPAVAVLVEALAGSVPNVPALVGMAVSILGVCMVSLSDPPPSRTRRLRLTGRVRRARRPIR